MNLDLKFYWGLFLRRLPIMLALFLVCSISASVSALKMPPTYSASAQLLVEDPQISMVRTLVGTNAAQQLQVIEQRLMTRANMLDIARKFSVFENIREMSPDRIVERMRAQTSMRRTGGRDLATLMRVEFTARDGRIAANVVNEYVTLILQESNDIRMNTTENTLAFFEQEAQRLSDDLDQQSARIVEFKNVNANALPGDLNFRQNRQSNLQERQARLEREIATLENQRRDMIAVFEDTGQVNAAPTRPLTPEEQQLEKMRFDLEQALAIYSDTNPRVTLLRNRIAQMEKTVREKNLQLPDGNGDGDKKVPTLLELTLAEMDQRLESMREELALTTENLATLTASIQATAANAITLNALERDFENIQTRYSDAIRNLNQARMSERVEVSAQGQRISVIENATVPQQPSGPNRFKTILMGVGAGLGLAGGFFLLMELINRTIRRPHELQERFGIIPLAVIPYMESKRERLIRRSLMVGAVLLVLIGVPAVLWYVDTSYMPLDILASKVMSRLGLS